MLIELAVFLAVALAYRQIERDYPGVLPPDWGTLGYLTLLYVPFVFWLARWRPWTLWITGGLWLVAMLGLMLFAAALFIPSSLSILALGLFVVAAWWLGKSQHRK